MSYKTHSIQTPETYSKVAVALHWLVAAALLAQFLLGWWMLDIPKDPPGVRAWWFNLHKSIGLCIALAVALRLAWRASHPVGQHPGLPVWQRRVARVSHWLLYLCTAALPVTGLLGSMFTKYPVLFFGIRLLPRNHDWPAAKQWMSQLHYCLVWMLMALVLLHIAAAARHWWRNDGVAQRMGLHAWRTHSHARSS
ncbi:cytochrome b [Caenimonas aquaedulcis]|uniref:Cytochrome b n=1 Tax=Caenimonas aquaedulcis TaxID=2793270 RepID=A0A931H2W5_9BURK|nr:cytochrome b [Caenimonas aquaedulcis]